MNVYSNDLFCEALQSAYYPNEVVTPTLFALEDRIWRLPALDARQPIVLDPVSSTCVDFYESAELPPSYDPQQLRKVNYLPQVCHGVVTAPEWFSQGLDRQYTAAPTIFWEKFPDWQDFVEHRRQHHSRYLAESRRCRRKLEEQLSSLEFVFNDRRPSVMGMGMRLKAAQYDRTNAKNIFVSDEHVRLFKALAEKGLLVVSSLNAGDRILAVHLGIVDNRRMYWWIPSYDTAHSKYSPGRILLEFCLEESHKQGHQEFDFMIGDESYKWQYATHTRLIAPLGKPPLRLRAAQTMESTKNGAKALLRPGLQRFPGLRKSLTRSRSPQPRVLSSEIPGEDNFAPRSSE